MKKETTYWIEFYSPGSFCANTWTKDVDKLPEPNSVEIPENAYSFTLNKREDIIDGDKKYKGTSEQVGPMYYHPDSKVTTLEETRGHSGATKTLISNMMCNNWDSVIWTRWGNWPQPFNADKQEVVRAL